MIGVVNVIVSSTSSPVNAPSPLVRFTGILLMPFTTVLPTWKFSAMTLAENLSVPELAGAVGVAVPISTSEGDLSREGTLPDGGIVESRGKTWYTSISTSLMFVKSVLAGINPVIVALLITAVCCKTKSSAVSVSTSRGWHGGTTRPACRQDRQG